MTSLISSNSALPPAGAWAREKKEKKSNKKGEHQPRHQPDRSGVEIGRTQQYNRVKNSA